MNDDEKQKTIRELKDRILALTKQASTSMKGEPIQTVPCEIETVLNGHYEPTPFGSIFVARSRFHLGDFQGTVRIRKALDLPMAPLSVLVSDPRIKDLPARDALYMDTETTGLSPALGAYAFCIGIGYFVEDHFIVDQIFLRDHLEEPAALHLFLKHMSQRSLLVTFNGKAFDVPMLQARINTNKMDADLYAVPHMDILIPARRFWKGSFAGCSLSTLEQNVISFFRHDDVPGHQIPDLYNEYLSTKNAGLLKGVFDHNVFDVLSMPVLLHKIGRIATGENLDALTPNERFSYGHWIQSLKDLKQAAEIFENCVPELSGELRIKGLKTYAKVLKKLDCPDRAAPLFAELIILDEENLYAYMELAKYFEHHENRYDLAIKIVEAAEKRVVFTSFEKKKKLEKRKLRLYEKLKISREN